MSKTYRYNPDTNHKDAQERHHVKRKLKQSEPRPFDRALLEELPDDGEEADEAVRD